MPSDGYGHPARRSGGAGASPRSPGRDRAPIGDAVSGQTWPGPPLFSPVSENRNLTPEKDKEKKTKLRRYRTENNTRTRKKFTQDLSADGKERPKKSPSGRRAGQAKTLPVNAMSTKAALNIPSPFPPSRCSSEICKGLAARSVGHGSVRR